MKISEHLNLLKLVRVKEYQTILEIKELKKNKKTEEVEKRIKKLKKYLSKLNTLYPSLLNEIARESKEDAKLEAEKEFEKKIKEREDFIISEYGERLKDLRLKNNVDKASKTQSFFEEIINIIATIYVINLFYSSTVYLSGLIKEGMSIICISSIYILIGFALMLTAMFIYSLFVGVIHLIKKVINKIK